MYKRQIEYYPGDGRKQNVHSKAWQKINEQERTERIERLSKPEEKFANATPAQFSRALVEAKKNVLEEKRWRVTAYDPDHYVGSKLHVTEAGSTAAVDASGDIFSVCRRMDDNVRGTDLVKEAIRNGGVKLDSYSGNHVFYIKNGFEPISWCEWDDEFKPPDWREEYGREPIIFYRYTGKVPEEIEAATDFFNRVPLSSDYPLSLIHILYTFSRELEGRTLMAELQGIEYLRKKLEQRRKRVLIRYKQYDMKYQDKQLGLTIPPALRQQYKAVLGWCGKAVDSIADRLVFREFAEDNFNLMQIYQMNNPDVLFDSAILSALISSCSFIYISPGEDGMPRLQVIDGANATGVIDEITGLMYEGYAVLDRDENNKPMLEAYFQPGETTVSYTHLWRNQNDRTEKRQGGAGD